ncbi:MAG: hypothetical protein AAGE01_04075 [Pseudomonadota bacterium]
MKRPSSTRILAALWGLVGFSALLASAIVRLAEQAREAITQGLGPLEWALLGAFCLFMAYSEGYRGFQQRFSPRFADRIIAVRDGHSLLEALLAPLYAMGFFRATRRQMITTYALTALILAFIFLFRIIPQPWRGVLDAGVVVGLVWGLIATWAWTVQRWRQPGSHLVGDTAPSS